MKQRVLTLVAEKTGYPVDMLDLDLDLEADLGIDTVKQAEVFAGVREMYDIPRDENRKLRDYPTLAHVIRFVMERASKQPSVPKEPVVPVETVVPTPTRDAAVEPSTIASASDPVMESLLELVSQKTGYPKDMLDLDLDLEADLGIDTVKQAEVFAAVRQMYNIPRDENRKLRDYPTLAHVIRLSVRRGRSCPRKPGESRQLRPGGSRYSADRAERFPQVLTAVPTPSNDDDVQQTVLDIVAEKTGIRKTCSTWNSISKPT